MKTISILVLAVTLLVPAQAMGWSSFGASEPDTGFDSNTLTWFDAPGVHKDRIYFNGFTVMSVGIVSLGVNPNAGVLETRNEPAGIDTYVAILGNWADCNGDGYIGIAEGAQREYDALLLLSDSICPAHTGPNSTWDGSHNYNGWVTELIPVGTDGGQPSASPSSTPDPEDNDQDLRIIRDVSARVWGDFGLPNDAGPEASGGSCPIRPFPRGTVQSTGGALNYADCFLGTNARWNQVWGEELTLLPGNDAETTVPLQGDPLGLRFADEDDAKTGVLGQVATLGSEDSNEAAVVLTDCTAEPMFDSSATFNSTNAGLGNPVGEEEQALFDDFTRTKLYPLAPSPTRDTESPTVAGQYNQTNEEMFSDCDTSNDDGADIYGLVEGDFEGTSATDKRGALFNMEFEDNGILGNTPRGGVSDGIFGFGEASFPDQFHSGRSGASLNNQPGVHDWFARVASVKGTPNTVTTRGTIAGNDITVVPENGRTITYYAHVGSATLGAGYKIPGPAIGPKYGAAQCGSFTSDTHNGWQCDASLWYKNAIGTPQPEVQGGMARPGMTYNMRDVDCEDGSNNLGVPLGAPSFGDGACAQLS